MTEPTSPQLPTPTVHNDVLLRRAEERDWRRFNAQFAKRQIQIPLHSLGRPLPTVARAAALGCKMPRREPHHSFPPIAVPNPLETLYLEAATRHGGSAIVALDELAGGRAEIWH